MAQPTGLRVEHVDLPLGLTVREPRLSWRLPEGTDRQLAYRIRTTSWDSGKVDSADSVLVGYAGPPLRSHQRVEWTVKVWTEVGESEWAEPGWWEMGLLEPGDWAAQWIEPLEAVELRRTTPRPAYLLRSSMELAHDVGYARLYVTAHGIFEFFLNGQRVGDFELTPGFTSYWSALHVQTFDVGEYLVPGRRNVLTALVSDGWFRGQTTGARFTNFYGDSVALLAQLDVVGADGVLTRATTGPGWEWRVGAIRAADLFQGQTTDLRVDPLAEGSPKSDGRGGWSPVVVRDYDMTRLVGSPAPPVRRVEEVKPIAITHPSPGRQIVDLGQNINGWVKLENLGPEGTELTLTHAEALAEDGDITLENLIVESNSHPALDLPEFVNLTAPFQVDSVISAGHPAQVFEPRHTAHGFRYVRVEGHPATLTAEDVTGVVVHTDMRRTGWFECSDERINKLHEAAVWSFRDNACEIPTDCPTRERSGWTGDWQIFVPSAALIYDVAGFSTKWLRDLAAEQQPDGVVMHIVPNSSPMHLSNDLGTPHGSAGWCDAAVIVPWEIYRAYGDERLLAEQWPSMTAWVDYAARRAREHRHPSRVAKRPVAAPHEEFLWDSGFHYGEWLAPGDWDLSDGDLAVNLAALAAEDQGDVATAFLHYSATLLSRIARVLARDDDAERYGELAAASKSAWQTEFITPAGTLTRDTQPTYVRALAFDLVPEEQRASMTNRLVELVRADGNHLGTGFLATPYLLPALAGNGRLDVAYELLLQDTPPSWLAMIDRGATTVWEHWAGIDDDGRPHHSLNHYSKGAIISFLYRYVAGLQLPANEVAYRHFRIEPRLGGGLTWARARHDSPYGVIESAWTAEDGQLSLDVTVPDGCAAEVVLPDGRRVVQGAGQARFRCAL